MIYLFDLNITPTSTASSESFCASQDSEDGSFHPASLTSTQKTDTSQAGSVYQQPDVGDADLVGDESEEEEEEIQDAKLFLVRKENLWQILSKCQEPGCSEQCEITSHNKGNELHFCWFELNFSIYPELNTLFTGAQVVADMVCTQGHHNTWSSCPNLGSKKSAASINIDLTSSIFLSRLRFDRVKVTFRFFPDYLFPLRNFCVDEYPVYFTFHLLQCKFISLKSGVIWISAP